MSHENSGHEEIHLPGPSWAPIIVAAGMTLTLTGLVVGGLALIGVIVLVIGVGLWAFTAGK